MRARARVLLQLTAAVLVGCSSAAVEPGPPQVLEHENGWRIQIPRNYASDAPRPLVVFLHQSKTGDVGSPWDEPRMQPVTRALERAGYIVAAATDGQRWGNQQSQDNYVALARWVQANYSVSYVVLLGASMGGLPALNIAASGALPGLRAVGGIGACTSLASMYNHPYFTEDIEAAYGFRGVEEFASATEGFDPMQATPDLFAQVAIRFWASPADALVPKADHADAFAWRIGGQSGNASVVSARGRHLARDQYRPDEVVAFFDSVAP